MYVHLSPVDLQFELLAMPTIACFSRNSSLSRGSFVPWRKQLHHEESFILDSLCFLPSLSPKYVMNRLISMHLSNLIQGAPRTPLSETVYGEIVAARGVFSSLEWSHGGRTLLWLLILLLTKQLRSHIHSRCWMRQLASSFGPPGQLGTWCGRDPHNLWIHAIYQRT